ncbi:SufE family protein [Hahella ganghwensis]|uniref:SufE family protein n=1 Tax=Hahella ganghwensis TaxID=286420 RepID=UPI0003626970|nr:SufE family protein [Hahella ganghwensis]
MTAVADITIFKSNPLGTDTTLEEVKENFEFLDDWEDRYGYVIDLGKKAPAMPEEHRTEENYIHGCQSQVWFVHYFDKEHNKLYVLVDSDAMIVRGLAAVVMIAFNSRSPQDIAQFDMDALFQDLDLLKHLSPTRGNGLRAMVKKIQDTARQCAQA